jgi:peptidoglycan/xylan/chitin deacetylase (PgdA/CDA1 family)
MNFIKILIPVLFIATIQQLKAEQQLEWNGKKCAVVLTYDDALNVHLDYVIPELNRYGFKGTFYLYGEAPVLSQRMKDWRKAAKHGHELGNHTLNHPCDGQLPGRSWVSSESDLSKYTVDRAVNETRVTSTLLQAIDGKSIRTFAYPCGDWMIDTVNYYKFLENEFPGARGVQEGLKHINEVDLNNINCYAVNGQTGDYLISLVDKALESHTLLVFLFHGVGGEHNINVSAEAHNQLLDYLNKHKKEIWVAPLVDVSRYIKEQQK